MKALEAVTSSVVIELAEFTFIGSTFPCFHLADLFLIRRRLLCSISLISDSFTEPSYYTVFNFFEREGFRVCSSFPTSIMMISMVFT